MYDVKVHNSGRGKKEWKNDIHVQQMKLFHIQGHENNKIKR